MIQGLRIDLHKPGGEGTTMRSISHRTTEELDRSLVR